jgi:hypothetical protein
MRILNVGLAKESKKQVWVFIAFITLFASCQQKECAVIKNNSYKGYGLFYFTNRNQNLSVELRFIPVCTEKEDLIHCRNLNPQTGIDVYCDEWDDSFLKNIAMHSKTVPGADSLEYYLTPAYIEFEEAGNYRELLGRSNVNQPYLQKDIPLNDRESLTVSYFFSTALLSQIIQINQIEFFSFVEE